MSFTPCYERRAPGIEMHFKFSFSNPTSKFVTITLSSYKNIHTITEETSTDLLDIIFVLTE